MLLIGIDEAGYGPTLGPFCHGYCAIRIPDQSASRDLWELLSPTVSRFPCPPERATSALAIDDSKKVYSASNGYELLQSGVHSFLHSNAAATFLAALLNADERTLLENDPWGCGEDRARPGCCTILPPALTRSTVEVVAVGARAMNAADFNDSCKRLGNKAEVNIHRVREILSQLLGHARAGETIVAVIDRLGGRKFYGECVQKALDGAFVWVEEESSLASIYRAEFNSSTVRVEFRVGGEGESLCVALASMCAKLTRELCMERFNAYFLSHEPELKPTAGYAVDARRFLDDTKALRKKLKIQDERLIRFK